ncbi:uncharacterized protein LOC135084603 [Ostrinia nubilalis]|uniref:uncharacterized protein LOC135084603 n=1 Tax=Ostrinia nubilalis TaxID=29057 RepID=UPI0010387100|nr:uncharacterized protein LOC114350832 isoform X2 [Ostrinia furnacalis]
MGNKRKYNSEEEIRRKIQKLEKKLQKTREHVQISDEEPNLDAIVEEDVGSAVISLQDENHPESLWPESPCPVSPARLDSPERAAPGLISPSKSIPGPSSPKETQEVVPSESQRKADNKTTAAAARGRPAYRTTRPGPSDSYRPPHRSPPHQPPPPSSRRTHRT